MKHNQILLALLFCAAPLQANAAPDTLERVYRAAVEHADRSGADQNRDPSRKPLEILPFIGLEPGMTVLELGAGGGYTTRLAALVTGPQGQVYAQALAGSPGMDNITALPAHPLFRLREVARAAGLGAGQADVILMFFTLHDMYLDDNIDKLRLYRDLYTLLKPGGVLVILDNNGVAGSGLSQTRATHRIDKQFIIDELGNTKFRFDGETDALRNPDDDVTRSWTQSRLRGFHDRFALRFRRPAE